MTSRVQRGFRLIRICRNIGPKPSRWCAGFGRLSLRAGLPTRLRQVSGSPIPHRASRGF